MSKKQWGHGFHSGVKSAKKDSLVGMWFHTRDENGDICWQGVVDKYLKGGNYVVYLANWLSGSLDLRKTVSFKQMRDWEFYETHEEMNRAYELEALKYTINERRV
jgi:hypothetical protein